jgi:tripartite-type tricarboxylate transporter receptor subunit TctC
VKALKKPEVKQHLFNSGVEGIGSTPEEFTARVKADIVRWAKIIKEAGIRGE